MTHPAPRKSTSATRVLMYWGCGVVVTVLLILVLVVGSARYFFGAWFTAKTAAEGEQISEEIRSAIHARNELLLNAVGAGDIDELMRHAAKAVTVSPTAEVNARTGLSRIGSLVAENEYSIYREYEVTVAEYGERTLPFVVTSVEDYAVYLSPVGKHLVLSVVKFDLPLNEPLLAIQYTFEDEEWRWFSINVGVLRVGGRDAFDWLAEAEERSKNGQHLQAYLRAIMSSKLASPLQQMQYLEGQKLQSEIPKFVNASSLPSFPIKLEKTDPPVEIYGIKPTVDFRGLMPLLTVVTEKDVGDPTLSDDAVEIMQELSKIVPDVCQTVEVAGLAFLNEFPVAPANADELLTVTYDCAKQAVIPAEKFDRDRSAAIEALEKELESARE